MNVLNDSNFDKAHRRWRLLAPCASLPDVQDQRPVCPWDRNAFLACGVLSPSRECYTPAMGFALSGSKLIEDMQYRAIHLSGQGRRTAEAQFGRKDGSRAERSTSLDLPADLGTWVWSGTLHEWIRAETDKLSWSHPQVEGYLRRHPSYPPRKMLTLLSLAYACGVFSSGEVVRFCRSDAIFQAVCQGQVPFAHEVQSFRRHNRALLERVLSHVLLQAYRHRFNLAPDPLSFGLEAAAHTRAVERIDLARHLDGSEE